MDKLNEWDKKLEESKQKDKEKKKEEPKFKERWEEEMAETEKKVRKKQEAKKFSTSNEKRTEHGGRLTSLFTIFLSIPIFLIGILAFIFLVSLIWTSIF